LLKRASTHDSGGAREREQVALKEGPATAEENSRTLSV